MASQPHYLQYPSSQEEQHSTQIQPPNQMQAPSQIPHQPQLQASTSQHPIPSNTSEWAKDLVQLAKTAELKRHALTLQMHTAHILSAHASLEQKSKMIQDLKEQKNKLDSERNRLLNCLREVNEDRDKAQLMEINMDAECNNLRQQIASITEGDYALAKREVDTIRADLGQAPLPTLQNTIDEKTSQYLTQRRLSGIKRSGSPIPGQPAKRPRGRPKGSKTKKHAPPAEGSAGQ
ncbi:hypothetical protein BD626DRAFT_508587 [Schizophyllum amplum]|uniref:Uncharacterized protein n=1 Tax=Schizophyllum amplum TaxID=97359 RepID=A0A550C357_9AGAR|nr:hypothetical protein BD626DRAFT_508587 [Auriculariopsis ampla]